MCLDEIGPSAQCLDTIIHSIVNTIWEGQCDHSTKPKKILHFCTMKFKMTILHITIISSRRQILIQFNNLEYSLIGSTHNKYKSWDVVFAITTTNHHFIARWHYTHPSIPYIMWSIDGVDFCKWRGWRLDTIAKVLWGEYPLLNGMKLKDLLKLLHMNFHNSIGKTFITCNHGLAIMVCQHISW